MLHIYNVDFNYGSRIVFNDLNFDMEKGEFVFLIGKSGSGKSTLLQLIYMNIFPISGTVEVDRFNSKTIKPKELPFLRRKLGIVFQDFKLLSDRNIYENLEFVLRSTGVHSKDIKNRIGNVLTDVGLFHRRFSRPNELSGGEKQRVAIARAIVNEPSLILADEPTGNLDPDTSCEILDLLTKINSKGTAVLFATHNYEIVKKFSARIAKIDEGKIFKASIKQK